VADVFGGLQCPALQLRQPLLSLGRAKAQP